MSLTPLRSKCSHALRQLHGRVTEDRGNALLEFVALAVLLLIPTVYLVIALGRIQGGIFAADSISREGARIMASTSDASAAERYALTGTELILADYGFSAGPSQVLDVNCSASPCRQPGASVEVRADVLVSLPGLGGSNLGVGPIAVNVTSSHLLLVDPFISGVATNSEGGEQR